MRRNWASSQASSDEGDFWEKRDVKALARQVGEWNQDMAAMVGRVQGLARRRPPGSHRRVPGFEHLEARGRRRKKK